VVVRSSPLSFVGGSRVVWFVSNKSVSILEKDKHVFFFFYFFILIFIFLRVLFGNYFIKSMYLYLKREILFKTLFIIDEQHIVFISFILLLLCFFALLNLSPTHSS
jgi:hypothetical protein